MICIFSYSRAKWGWSRACYAKFMPIHLGADFDLSQPNEYKLHMKIKQTEPVLLRITFSDAHS